MQTLHFPHHSAFEITQILSEYPAVCDSDFDAEYEELERQFAELRLFFSDNDRG